MPKKLISTATFCVIFKQCAMAAFNQRPKKNPKNDRKIGLQKPEIPLLTPIILKVNSASALL